MFILVSLNFFEKNFSGVMPFEITVDTHKKNGVSKSSTLRRVEKLENVLNEYPQISRSTDEIVKMVEEMFKLKS